MDFDYVSILPQLIVVYTEGNPTIRDLRKSSITIASISVIFLNEIYNVGELTPNATIVASR